MSSVRNRILQFQQNGSSPPPSSSSSSSTSLNGTNGYNKLSPYGRSNGSIPPDIVVTTNGRSNGQHSRSSTSKDFGLNYNNINNSSSINSFASTLPSGSASKASTNLFPSSAVATSSVTSEKNHTANSYFGNTYGSGGSSSTLKTTTVTSNSTNRSSNGHSVNIRKFSGNFSDSSASSHSSSSTSSPLQSTWRSGGAESKRSPLPEPSTASIVRTVEIPLLKSAKSSSPLSSTGSEDSLLFTTPPVVNRANKPLLAMKKASMTINLSSTTSASSSPSPPGTTVNGNNANLFGSSSINNTTTPTMNRSKTTLESPTRPKARTPLKTSPISSSIPKLNSGGSTGNGFGFGNGTATSSSTASTAPTVRYRDPSPGGIGRRLNTTIGSNRSSPATTPTGGTLNGGVAFGSTFHGTSSTGRFYQSIGWKEKYEESEKKKNHLVTLAQRATRDYEELRRRYHDLYQDHEKLVARFDSATTQLESLRKASEATYIEYHKLKRRYETENVEKSEALTRVDEYNKENRRLKRQSALMMQQIDPTALLANPSLFESVPEGESVESDKEIQYLRNKVKELEARNLELEAELERIRLSEFESQESVLLMNDSIQCSKSENLQLKEQLRKLDEENRKLARSLEDLSLAHDSLKSKQSVDTEKLTVAETELKKLLTEKNILQRQSLVFMQNEEMDNRLLDALAQIDELQRSVEDQKNTFESQITDLQNRLSEKELEEETADIQHNAKIKALEEEIHSLRQRAEEAEKKFEDCSMSLSSSGEGSVPTTTPPPPPPPPPPMMGGGSPAPPPPPPPPSFSLTNANGTVDGLGSSLQAAMGALKKGGARSNLETSPNGSCDGQSKNLVSASPQIDDIVSQLKQGIKLRHIDRTMPRKQITPQKSEDADPVDKLRSVLDNMRRTRTVERRF